MLFDRKEVTDGFLSRGVASRGVTLVHAVADAGPEFRRAVATAQEPLRLVADDWRSPAGDPVLALVPQNQCHATISGLEAEVRSEVGDPYCVNRNLIRRHRQLHCGDDARRMKFEALVAALRALASGMRIRFGFPEGTWNPYEGSADRRRLDERTVSISPQGLVAIVGVPVTEDGSILPTLGGFRHALEVAAAVVHKYHVVPGSFDNDYYAVIAVVRPALFELERDAIERFCDELQRARLEALENLSRHPVDINVKADECRVVRYATCDLRPSGVDCRIPAHELSVDDLRRLYFDEIIDNRKLDSLRPDWRAFRGFSFVFDPASTSLVRHQHDRLRKIHCGGESFCQRLSRAFDAERWVVLRERFLLCRLPINSYHVTVWDGVNDDNVHKLEQNAAKKLRVYLNRLDAEPCSFLDPLPVMTPSREFPPLCESNWIVRFRFLELRVWGAALVARIAAADRESELVLGEIAAARAALDERCASYGKPKSRSYHPHVSIGYFATPPGEVVRPLIARWSEELRDELDDVVLEYSTIGLYAFTDMATFFRATESTTRDL